MRGDAKIDGIDYRRERLVRSRARQLHCKLTRRFGIYTLTDEKIVGTVCLKTASLRAVEARLTDMALDEPTRFDSHGNLIPSNAFVRR